MTDLNHMDAITERLRREKGRLAVATTAKEQAFRKLQVAYAEKELAAEMKFLGIEDAPEFDGNDDDLLAALGMS